MITFFIALAIFGISWLPFPVHPHVRSSIRLWGGAVSSAFFVIGFITAWYIPMILLIAAGLYLVHKSGY